jgi:hypothetical protein
MKKGKSTITGFGAALLAILGSITCCGAPIAAGILASVGIGASQLEFLNNMQPYLIGIALVSLAIGFYRLYFKKQTSCCGTDSESSKPASNTKSKLFLWIVTIFIIGMHIYTNNTNTTSSTESCCPAPIEVERTDCACS